MKKLEYHFSVESTKTDNATFPYKTVLSKANARTNRMGKKGPVIKNEASLVTTLFFENFVLV